MNKEYGLGIVVGRFQVVHIGHEKVIREALTRCERVGVLVGSARESRTKNNPFTYAEREDMLKRIFPCGVCIIPLRDMFFGDAVKWGEYVLQTAAEGFGEFPGLIVSGEEQRRAQWFKGERGSGVDSIFIPKDIDISASALRDRIASGDRESFEKYTDPALWDSFDFMREIIIRSQSELKTESI